MGAIVGLNCHKDGWVKEIQDAADGHKAEMIIDFIGKKVSQENLEVEAQDGRIIQLAVTNGDILNIGLSLGLLMWKRVRWEEVV